MGDFGEKVSAIIAAIVSLAVLAIVVSQRANTTNVVTAFFSGISNLIAVAISPVTGTTVSGATAGGLVGGTWDVGSSGTVGSSGAIAGLASLTGGLVNASGVSSLLSGTGTGAVDSGTWDTGSQQSSSGAVADVGSFLDG